MLRVRLLALLSGRLSLPTSTVADITGFEGGATLRAPSRRLRSTAARHTEANTPSSDHANHPPPSESSPMAPHEDTPKPEPLQSAGRSAPTTTVADAAGSSPGATAGEAGAKADGEGGASKKATGSNVRSQISLLVSVVGLGAAATWSYLNQETIMEKIRFFTEPSREKLLPDPLPMYPGGPPLRTLVIELDDTLVHSMWSRASGWRTTKRPGVEAFLAYMASFYEIVVFTSQLPTYADPVLDKLDPNGYIMHRLYRDATKYQDGVHIKDLSKLNRDLSRTILIDTSRDVFQLQPANGICILKWDRDHRDRTLLDLIPFLESIVRDDVSDVRPLLASYGGMDIAKEYARRKEAAAHLAQASPQRGLSGLIGSFKKPGGTSSPTQSSPSSSTPDFSMETSPVPDSVAKGGEAQEKAGAKGSIWQRIRH